MIEPAPLIDVIVEDGAWDGAADATVRRALTEAATATGMDFKDRTLAVLLTDDAAIRRLNAQWRGIDKPTNVLSFPSSDVAAHSGGVRSLGDIAIAYETTAREASEEEKSFADHLAHLAVHGFLHLLGHDHDTEAAAEKMERLERVILGRIGIPDPYADKPLAHEQPVHEIRG